MEERLRRIEICERLLKQKFLSAEELLEHLALKQPTREE